ncbi:hypothetical protein BDR26DRAFT_855244 [Obelidium mucronatum]|nr:hypothetical protein BDR26DRAFT_855244 [Obelidium mucronatum]
MVALAYPYTKEWRNDNESKTQPERKRNVNYHALLQILACISACVGFWAVNQNKTNKGKTHWESWHGVIGFAMRFFPVASFGSLVKCRCWLDFKRYSGVVVILLTLYVTGTGLLERSVMQRFPMWQRYSIFCVVLSATGFCLWNCVFEYAIKGIACLRRRGPAYEELA